MQLRKTFICHGREQIRAWTNTLGWNISVFKPTEEPKQVECLIP